MSGHNKWSTIKRKKEKTDGARAKVFTKMGREIAVAVKQGGPDPNNNSKLKDVIAKAKAANVPNDNIERIIKKAAGDSSADNYEEIIYEGYGPAGVAVVVEALTDNRNRTAGDVRHYFDKYGGNMEAALEAGAEDVIADDGVFDVRTGVHEVADVAEALTAAGYTVVSAQAEYVPSTYVKLEGDNITQMGKMLEMFEDNDDIQAVWHNWENEDDYE